MAKLVKVVRETVVTYKVDTAPGQKLADEDAIDIVKKRIEAEAPMDIVDETSTIKKFTVADA